MDECPEAHFDFTSITFVTFFDFEQTRICKNARNAMRFSAVIVPLTETFSGCTDAAARFPIPHPFAIASRLLQYRPTSACLRASSALKKYTFPSDEIYGSWAMLCPFTGLGFLEKSDGFSDINLNIFLFPYDLSSLFPFVNT